MRAKVQYWLAPGLQSVELTAADYVAQRFSSHWHAGFAIGAVTRHAQGFHAEGREWVIEPGDLILLNPGQIHDGYSLGPGGWSSRMAYVPESTFDLLSGGCNGKAGRAMRFPKAVAHSPALSRAFLEWHTLTESTRDVRSHPFTAQVFTGLLELMHAGAWPASKAEGAGATELGARLHQLAVHGDATVASLNFDLGLTRFGSWRRVKSEFGMAPKPLLSHIRLMSAKQLLARGCPVIEAALNSGYHDQSHFSRQFAATYGFTPAQFRRVQLSRGHVE